MTDTAVTDAPTFFRDEARGTDIAEAMTSRAAHYRGRNFAAQRSEEPFEYHYLAAGDERLVLQTTLFTAFQQGEVPFPRHYIVTWFRRGMATYHHRGATFTSNGSVPFLIPAETPFHFRITPREQRLVRAGTDFLEQTASERHGGPPQRVVFDPTAVPTTEAVALWRTTVAENMHAVITEDVGPLVRLEAQLALARGMLDLFPWQPIDLPESIRRPRVARIRDAVEYIHTHAHEPITPSDIAAAVGIHTRTLQIAMGEHFDTTPSGYLRRVRLDRVRQELQDAGPSEAFVSDVARRWGFGNLGRFSSAYLKRFGEYPRDTLGRGGH